LVLKRCSMNFKPLVAFVQGSFSLEQKDSPMHQSILFVAAIVMLSVAILAVLLIPSLASFNSAVEAGLSHFNKLQFQAIVDAKTPFQIGPVAFSANSSAPIVASSSAITYVEPRCLILPFACARRQLNYSFDFLSSPRESGRLARLGLLILSPAILMGLFFALLIRYLIIIIAVAAIATLAMFLIFRSFRPLEAFNIACHSSAVLIIPEVINLSLQLPLSFIPMAAFIGLIIVKLSFLAGGD